MSKIRLRIKFDRDLCSAIADRVETSDDWDRWVEQACRERLARDVDTEMKDWVRRMLDNIDETRAWLEAQTGASLETTEHGQES